MIYIKPHHFVDIVTACGRGARSFEPHPYGHAVHRVAEQILADLDVILVVELGADDVCTPCARNIRGLCDDTIDTSFRPGAPTSRREWNLRLDRRWCARLSLALGDRLSARQLCLRLRDRAGDIAEIYREEPVERTAERAASLCRGVELLLARPVE